MKISELQQTIKEIIIEILSEGETVAWGTSNKNQAKQNIEKSKLAADAKKEAKKEIDDNPSGIISNVPTNEAEEALTEMASFYKVKDKAGFKSALAKYKELKGDKFDKGALGKLLSTLDKEGEVDLKALSKETGKDIATYNNPQTRGALEKEGGEFTDYLEAGKGEKAPKEKAEDKPKAEPKKAEKKAEPKKEKPAPKKEEPKKAEKEEDEDDSTEEKEPTKAELKKLEKELGSKNKKKDEIISAYKKIAGDIKEKAKAANSGDKEAKAWIDKHQDIIKAYRKLQKVG